MRLHLPYPLPGRFHDLNLDVLTYFAAHTHIVGVGMNTLPSVKGGGGGGGGGGLRIFPLG